jgi:4-hydroxythreonine-4-phosphate dehydrogenase
MNNNKQEENEFDFLEYTAPSHEHRPPVVVGIAQSTFEETEIESILKAFHSKEMLEMVTPVIYGDAKTIINLFAKMNPDNIPCQQIQQATQIASKKINIVNTATYDNKTDENILQKSLEQFSRVTLQSSIKDLKENCIEALITTYADKKTHPSEFEVDKSVAFLTENFKIQVEDLLKIIVCPAFRIGFEENVSVTEQVDKELSIESVIGKINLMNSSLSRNFGIIKPKIAVLSQNMHLSEQKFADQDKNILYPAIKKCFDDGIMVYGTYDAETFFTLEKYKIFDGILSFHTDKHLQFIDSLLNNEGVMLTVELPVIVTIPIYNSKEQNILDDDDMNVKSIIQSLFLACDVAHNRKNHDEWYKNPLKIGLAQEIIGEVNDDENIDPFAEESNL